MICTVGVSLLIFLTVTTAHAQSILLPTDRGRVVVANIPDAYNTTGLALKVLQTDANSPLRAGTAWIWEKQGQEDAEPYYAKMRANGLNAVRMILFDTWEVEAYVPSPVFTPTDWNDPAYRTRQLARMERSVNYASAHGMYVIITSHNKIPNYNATYVNALWTYVAPYFANRTHVLYEASIEPMSGIGVIGDMDEPTGHQRLGFNGATSGSNYVTDFEVFAAAGNAMNKAVVRSCRWSTASRLSPSPQPCKRIALHMVLTPMAATTRLLPQETAYPISLSMPST